MAPFARIAVVFNPTKDYRKVESFVAQVGARCGNIRVDVLRTESFEDIERKADLALSGGCDLCVAAGGDGTVLGVLNAAIKHDTFFSILPLGTGNDFARSLGIGSVEDAVEVLFRRRVRQVDAGVCTYQTDRGALGQMYFGSTAGVGVLARVFSYERHAITHFLKRVMGNSVWPFLTVVSVLSGGTSTAVLSLNGATVTTRMRLFEVNKVRVVGGTVFAPHARTDNGIFDAWMLHEVGALGAIRAFKNTGGPGTRHLACPGVSYFTGEEAQNGYRCARLTEISVTPERPLPVHLNGDRVGVTPCRLRILPGKIKVLW